MFQVQKQHAIGFQGNIALVRQELKTVDFETTASRDVEFSATFVIQWKMQQVKK